MNANPQFDSPPVCEVVLSAQFAPLAGLLSPHVGWYWREYFGTSGSTVAQAAPLSEQFETFGDRRLQGRLGARVEISPFPPCPRIQIISDDQEWIVQVQQTRFTYNWRRRSGTYPTYEVLRPKFDKQFNDFREFCSRVGIGRVEPNQWEVTYVNQFLQGELWQKPQDFRKVLPGLGGLLPDEKSLDFEGVNGEWHFVIPPNRGRLHVALKTGKLVGESASASRVEEGHDVLLMHLTARGPVVQQGGSDLESGLELGHEVIVGSFVQMTSPEAHRFWGRRVGS